MGGLVLLLEWGLFLVLWDVNSVFGLIVVRIGTTPVSNEVVLIKCQQMIQDLNAPLKGTMKFVNKLGKSQVDTDVSASWCRCFNRPIEKMPSQMTT